ncbi:hypothetical protein CANARDRAFT_170623 [[Candida] arabinofermentans NRRL YB-2248]|uniref:Factor arrest protein 11 n=1 Tax=[Candida] arabinofermentans NRRL YB-2248 TaxID=983967 RepID=A0A1E4SZZ1_9ASCO|nr:hypothetical protein CANARDRAFT_170623 [[Candida] arabinofermentans NRRL YB-2248]
MDQAEFDSRTVAEKSHVDQELNIQIEDLILDPTASGGSPNHINVENGNTSTEFPNNLRSPTVRTLRSPILQQFPFSNNGESLQPEEPVTDGSQTAAERDPIEPELEPSIEDLEYFGFSDAVIDKGEMMETSDDQDILSSPHSSFSFGDDDDDNAKEIDGLNNFNIILEYPELLFNYKELSSFQDEINDWFCYKQLSELKQIKQVYETTEPLADFNGLETKKKVSILQKYSEPLLLADTSSNSVSVFKSTICLCYLAMGAYGTVEDQYQHGDSIVATTKLFTDEPILIPIISLIKLRATQLTDMTIEERQISDQRLLRVWSQELEYAMTILYIVLTRVLTDKEKDHGEIVRLREIVDKTDLLFSLVKSIDAWKCIKSGTNETEANEGQPQQTQSTQQKSNQPAAPSIKIRHVIQLLCKLLLLQFGDHEMIQSTKSFLKYKYEDGKLFHDSTRYNESNGSKKDVLSPLDYHYYRSELITRYPSFTPPKFEVSQILEISLNNDQDSESESISKYISTAALLVNQHHNLKPRLPLNQSMVPPEIHIATPAPSPTLSPQHTDGYNNHSNISELEHSNGQGRKKMFITQPHYPNLYPLTDEVPYSIKEAANIFYSHAEKSYKTTQFVDTYESFIKEEQGIKESNMEQETKKFHYTEQDLKENPIFEDEIKVLQRVEDFYGKCLPYLNSLVIVMLQIISSNTLPPPINLKTQQSAQQPYQKPPQKPYLSKDLKEYDKRKLDLTRVKEACLKSSSMILLLLQKWFKLSHILKHEYFTSLIFDNNYYQLLFKFLNSNQLDSQFDSTFDLNDPETLIKNRVVYCDYEPLFNLTEYNFFRTCLSLSNSKREFESISEEDQIDLIFKSDAEPYEAFFPPFNGRSKIKITRPNERYCVILTNLLKTLYHTISDFKIQRIYKLLEVRPTENLRFYLTLYNLDIYKPILKIVKLLSPFNGKKWRSNNMDLISFVYLFYDIGLRDQWLNNLFTINLSERLRMAWENESSLRCLLKYYHFKNYKPQMKDFGYYDEKFSDGDEFDKGGFFARELEKMDLYEFLKGSIQMDPDYES